MSYTVTYIHRRPALTVKFFADVYPQATAKIAAKVREANGFVSQGSVMSPDNLSNSVTVVWTGKGAYTQFNRRQVAVHYRRAREAYDAKAGTSTEIIAP